jgi:excinuclease UvrABC helicase subunit UvrB
MPRTTLKRAIKSIREELEWWEPKLIEEGKLLEAQRLHQRTMFDLEMLKEMGFCRGNRELFAHPHGEKARRAATNVARLFATRHAGRYRRVAPDYSAGARDVLW